MTVLATWLDISINLLLFVFVVVCLLMSMIILMQRPKNEGLGAAFGSNTTDQLFGARTTNVLQKATVYLSTLFFVITLTLAVLIGKRNASRPSLLSQAPVEEKVEEKPVSIAEEAAKDEKPIEPEAVTPAVQAPAETPTPAPTPAPAPAPAPGTEEPKPEGEPKPESTPAEETKPGE